MADAFWKEVAKLAIAQVFAAAILTLATIAVSNLASVRVPVETVYVAATASTTLVFSAALARVLLTPPSVRLGRTDSLRTPSLMRPIRVKAFDVEWVVSQSPGIDFRKDVEVESVRCPDDDTVLLNVTKRRRYYWLCPSCARRIKRPRNYGGNEDEAVKALALRELEGGTSGRSP